MIFIAPFCIFQCSQRSSNSKLHCPRTAVLIVLTSEIISLDIQTVLSPWHNRTGWLGVKHQLTYSDRLLHPMTCYRGTISMFEHDPRPNWTSLECFILLLFMCGLLSPFPHQLRTQSCWTFSLNLEITIYNMHSPYLCHPLLGISSFLISCVLFQSSFSVICMKYSLLFTDKLH